MAKKRKKKETRWAMWKRAQRKRPSKNARESRYKVRHHNKGGSVSFISRSRHAKTHWDRNDGSAGGRGKKRKGKKGKSRR